MNEESSAPFPVSPANAHAPFSDLDVPNLLAVRVFIPHGHCYLWKPELVSLHVISDMSIAIAYYSIPLGLIYREEFIFYVDELPEDEDIRILLPMRTSHTQPSLQTRFQSPRESSSAFLQYKDDRCC
ncbi:MAG: hypothetical protein KME17_18680 [Cyanosarcina radialis HA8281-LM2]|jgi:hypothetical protein|nr:hypothetical protein [Cyanosarcina radialis HA8281-LM2]